MDIQKVNGSNQREPETFSSFTSCNTNTTVQGVKNTEQDHKSTVSGYYFTTLCSQATNS